ncbi:bifunctional 2-polyprenyl-6-hydroxyphenol methylase/3-demethylubiquinol 3-O-methyltransferase UbiG [Methylobacterium gnaphalii]|uniref:Ubiquinone biosynthesis O-methyltransferase n=1 Tax=Methylobacterium gnaphalii TaxID=1010610 RepID=A0A512JM57_9HYPH|nr:bifunctional 2-polyprenyl-6-hydroxyphenol methylase/3-demethylubiquinol 3-O-methyltransferase UbiG [Methylobacterium gnaphalii]GEP11047.1 ubiquinone biosynthesis O-methyltransferase [Methylobacterium gnaphalii]GJD71513.1 Ubiquinone biosynthesis O-methyltransferase [Methylobacterium gnaphalii]GLS50325.1 ubiquinone biosynthesis O-methyltransferase [Methylobacterium gnaphalii]
MAASVDREEVARFDAQAATWWDANGPMRVLHRFNPVRLAYIRDEACRHFGRDPNRPFALEGLSLVDVGCGGGVLSEPLARLGAGVTGLDPAEKNIAVARAHAEAEGVTADYRAETIESVVERGERFDIVLAMEVVEHVVDRSAFLATCCAAVKPGGLLFAATLNRTMRSFALAIVGAEYVLNWLPKGTHDWEKFVKPDELTADLEAGGLSVFDTAGVVFDPLNNTWRKSRDTAVNYMVAARKD